MYKKIQIIKIVMKRFVNDVVDGRDDDDVYDIDATIYDSHNTQ